MGTYKANGKEFVLFSKAVREADSVGGTVTLVDGGRVVWSPAPPVSEARMRRYREQKAAYEAQQRAKGVE